jgi:hypothetical protein
MRSLRKARSGALLGGIVALTIIACTTPSRRQGDAPRPARHSAPDTSLLAAVLARLVEEGGRVPLRVDPRPLRPDPAIVELAPSLAQIVPEHVTTRADPLAPVEPAHLSSRARLIERLGLRREDAYSYPRCPGILKLGPPEIRPDPRPLAGCPADTFRVAILALPRRGGAYWPGSRIDERAGTPDGVWTVRVIERRLTPFGSSGSASDYVAQRDSHASWRILRRVGLLVTD